ncbi:AglZ/HisF2 family acetamidino modification protein [Acidovorax kalamii]|uniref:imidazole glycerol-phosphate synthase n=1 Tax=Acidovorax kalamii TaxID=2004485 RepID=A0A235EST1_9BURK|nr:AglZ/HisF2 family acetamidino modification protein [Acidovorax kalamii]OYD52108.1 imidazole glycerol phosphate synthase subunit HisF [Acidovorax kalamii]
MNKTRVIPVLLLRGTGLVKTAKFKDPKYIGDPINAIRIFNEKEVDELVFIDITASPEGRAPQFDLLKDIAGEAFMPMAYGGGVSSLDQIKKIFGLGFEKIIINTAAYRRLELISEAAAIFGSQSIVGAIDVKSGLWGGYELRSQGGRKKEPVGLAEHLAALERAGVGEVLVNSVDRDGTMSGYDLKLLKQVRACVKVPVVACGGAAGVNDFVAAVETGQADAVAAGSMFVFVGPHRAVLINYPERAVLARVLK